MDGAGPEQAVRVAMTATTAAAVTVLAAVVVLAVLEAARGRRGRRGMRTGRTITSVKRPWPAREAGREPRSAPSSVIACYERLCVRRTSVGAGDMSAVSGAMTPETADKGDRGLAGASAACACRGERPAS